MKKNSILVILIGIAPLQFVGQTQLSIDPNSTIQQLNFSSVVVRSPNEYFACGILPVGSDFGMITCFSGQQISWSRYFMGSIMSSMAVSSVGDLIVVGEMSGKAFISRISQVGGVVWVNSGLLDIAASPTHVTEAMDGHVFVTGQRFLANDQFLTKLSPAGVLVWAKKPLVSPGVADHPRILLRNDSLLSFNDPITNGGLAGDIELRVLDLNGNQLFHRTYGIPGNVREMLTSVVEMPGRHYVLAATRPGAIGIVVLDQNFDIVKSRSYTTPGGDLENGKLLYDTGSLFLLTDKAVSGGSPRALVLKLDTASLGIVWNRALSSANSIPSCEPFIDGTLRVPYMRYPSQNGSVRGVVLASLDPVTGNFTGTACENPPSIVINAGPYTGLTQVDQPPSVWVDLTIVPSPAPSFNGYPLLLEDCEPGILPIELLYFVGEIVDGETVRLSWATGSEEDVSQFVVERSLDCQDWEMIAEVLPLGSLGVETQYSIVDNEPSRGQMNYYRLREIGFGGGSVTFNIVPICVGLENLILSPNPIRRGEVLRARAPTTLEISDTFGRSLVRDFRELVVDLPAGNYIISTTHNMGSRQRTRLVVVE